MKSTNSAFYKGFPNKYPLTHRSNDGMGSPSLNPMNAR